MENKHQNLLNITQTLVYQASLLLKCATTIAFFVNRIPSFILKGAFPFELLYNKFPPYINLKVFGCLCYMVTTPSLNSKFCPKVTAYVFLKYSTRRSNQIHKSHNYLQDFLCSVSHLIISYLTYDKLSPHCRGFVFQVANIFESQIYHKALKTLKWRLDMDEELASFETNRTWTI
ncbi:hypothetical protein CR513_62802, partial [Mucuna pruriens]